MGLLSTPPVARAVLANGILQLIKQLSATPNIPAQRTAEEIAQDGALDPQAALRANKEVFFFRLVSSVWCLAISAQD